MVRGIRITKTSSSKPIAFSPGTAQPRKPVSGLNQQANKSLHGGSDSKLGGGNFFKEKFNEYPSCFDYRRTDRHRTGDGTRVCQGGCSGCCFRSARRRRPKARQ